MASECGISENLIKRLFNIYVALSSKLPLCPDKFETYCKETKALYVSELPWYPMCTSLHKILEHSADYLRLLPPTITSGMLSEEPSESANKDVKSWQIRHANQSSPEARNLSVFNRFYDRSDPQVLSILSEKKGVKSIIRPYPQEILDLQDYNK